MIAAERDEPLYSDPAFVSFYDVENGDAAEGGRADFAFCRRLAQEARSVLDLGCGTGELAASLAGGRHVVGVDPATAMLAVARQRPGGERVAWIEAEASAVRLDMRFDLIVMTGHAFQVLLDDKAVSDTLANIARHLSPAGRFIFDSRNPDRRAWQEWTPDRSRRHALHPELGSCQAWNDTAYDPSTGIATYTTCYQPDGAPLMATEARIRFIDQAHLARLIAEAGLIVDEWLGDWQGAPYAPDAREIIPIGRRA